jgi:hypothetical protein
MTDQKLQTKAIVTVAEMARMVGLSRARFYQLMQAGTFPMPLYDVRTRRPIYNEELQEVCLEVRRRHCGIDGRPVLFYARGHRLSTQARPAKANAKRPSHTDLIDGLAGLGLTSVTAAQVEGALRALFPSGNAGDSQGDVLRAVFLHLKRQNTGDNVGR